MKKGQVIALEISVSVFTAVLSAYLIAKVLKQSDVKK